MPKIEKVFIEERKVVKDKDGNDEKVFFMEEIDALAQWNTSQVIKILANPNDYSLEDILKLDKKEFKGVSEELKEKLVELAKQKYEEIRLQKEREFMDELRRKFNIDEEGKSNPKKREGVSPLEKDSDSPSEEETPLPTPQELPTPKDNNKDKNVYEFNEEQKAFSLSDLEQLEQFFIQNEIKNGAGDNTHQEFLDNLISQLTEEANASAKGPPPASKSFINKLPIVPKSDINSDETCIICADKFHGGGDKLVTSLPCKHKFDKECIIPWLELHNTCPNCRHEVDSDDPIWRQKQKDLKNQQIRQEDDEEDVDPIDFMYL
nr:15232_t:CDS:2 [Entrophospora candida]